MDAPTFVVPLFARPMLSLLVFVLVALPWLNPFAAGPTPAVWPLLFSWGCAALLLLLGLWRSGGGRWRHAVAEAWLVAGLVSCVIALVQYFGAADVFQPWISQTQLGEAFGNLRQRNQFATLTNIALAALLWLAGGASAGREAGRSAGSDWPAWDVLGAAGLLAVGNAASSSRTGLMQLGLLAALWLLWGGWRKPMVRRVLLTSLAVYVVALLALLALLGRRRGFLQGACRPQAGSSAAPADLRWHRARQPAPACPSGARQSGPPAGLSPGSGKGRTPAGAGRRLPAAG